MNKDRIRFVLTFLIALICTLIIYSLVFWMYDLILSKPLHPLGIITVYMELMNFSNSSVFTNPFSQSLLFVVLVASHFLLFLTCWGSLVGLWDKIFKNKTDNLFNKR